MKLKKISLENIRSYKNQEIEFPPGSTLLSGDIGSGKTSILLGIEFALFGLQPGQKGSSLLKNGENFGSVILEFEVDGKDVKIERTLKKSKSISQEDCYITLDGERKETSVMELKSLILKILNYPSEFSKKQNILYKFTVYTPQEEMKQIILQDPETRINTLRHIFGIDKYKKILENTSVLSAKIREEKKIKEGMISNMENDKLSLLSKEEETENKHYNLSSVEKELFAKTEERKKIQEERDEIGKKIGEKAKILQDIEKTKIIISNKNEMISENNKTIKHLNVQIKEMEILKFDESEILRLEENLKQEKRHRLEFGESLIKISSEINSLGSKNQENGEIKNRISHVEICPTCLQEVNVMYKNNILSRLNFEIFENLKKIESLSLEKRALEKNLSETDSEINSAEKKIQEHNLTKMKMDNMRERKSRVSEMENSNGILEDRKSVV